MVRYIIHLCWKKYTCTVYILNAISGDVIHSYLCLLVQHSAMSVPTLITPLLLDSPPTFVFIVPGILNLKIFPAFFLLVHPFKLHP